MLFVIASIQKFFFLPIEMVLLGVGKEMQAAAQAESSPPTPGAAPKSAAFTATEGPPSAGTILRKVLSHKRSRSEMRPPTAFRLHAFDLVSEGWAFESLWRQCESL